MRALSIRQPFAELILRGVKTVEYRTMTAANLIGQRFYIYASKKKLSAPCRNQRSVKVADNIVVPTRPLPAWMIELAEQVGMIEPDALLPTGVIVGTAVIEKVEEIRDNDEVKTMNDEVKSASNLLHRSSFSIHRSACPRFRWYLADVKRAKTLRKPKRHPQPVWFRPF